MQGLTPAGFLAILTWFATTLPFVIAPWVYFHRRSTLGRIPWAFQKAVGVGALLWLVNALVIILMAYLWGAHGEGSMFFMFLMVINGAIFLVNGIVVGLRYTGEASPRHAGGTQLPGAPR